MPPKPISHPTTSKTGSNGCAGDFGGDIHFDEDEDWTTNVRFSFICTAVPPQVKKGTSPKEIKATFESGD